MLYPLIVFLFLSGCVSVDEKWLLQNRYCPQVLVVKGAEMNAAFELAPVSVACDVDFLGAIGQPTFKVTAVNVNLGIWSRLRSPSFSGKSTSLTADLVYEGKQKSVKRWQIPLSPETEWRRQAHTIALTPKTIRLADLRQARLLVRLVPLDKVKN